MCMCVHFSCICTKEKNGWITRLTLLLEELEACFPKRLCHITFPPAVTGAVIHSACSIGPPRHEVFSSVSLCLFVCLPAFKTKFGYIAQDGLDSLDSSLSLPSARFVTLLLDVCTSLVYFWVFKTESPVPQVGLKLTM